MRWGVAYGAAAGMVASVVWFAVVRGTTAMQPYLIPAFGLAIAYGVGHGMRSHGRRAAVIACVLTLVALAIATYYVERFLVVQWFAANGDSISIPLVPYLDWLVEVLRHAFTKSPSTAAYWAVALLAAGWFGYHGFEARARHPRRR